MFLPPEMVGRLMVQTKTMEFQFVFLQLVHYSLVVVVHQLLLLLLHLLLPVHQLLFQLLQLLLPFVSFPLLLLVQVAYEDIPCCCVLLVCMLTTSTLSLTYFSLYNFSSKPNTPLCIWTCLSTSLKIL